MPARPESRACGTSAGALYAQRSLMRRPLRPPSPAPSRARMSAQPAWRRSTRRSRSSWFSFCLRLCAAGAALLAHGKHSRHSTDATGDTEESSPLSTSSAVLERSGTS